MSFEIKLTGVYEILSNEPEFTYSEYVEYISARLYKNKQEYLISEEEFNQIINSFKTPGFTFSCNFDGLHECPFYIVSKFISHQFFLRKLYSSNTPLSQLVLQ